MNDVERWIYFGGPPPEHIQRVLDVLRQDTSPETPEDIARESRRFGARLGALLGYDTGPAAAAEGLAPAAEGATPALAGAAPTLEGAAPTPRPPDMVPGGAERGAPSLAAATPFAGADAAMPFAGAAMPSAEVPAATPFAGAPAAGDAGTTDLPPALLPKVVPPNPALVGTADLPGGFLAPGNVLPFGPGSPGSPAVPRPGPAAPGRVAAKTLGSPARGADFGKTASLDEGTHKAAVAAIPYGESTGSPAIVFFPDMSLEFYASFSAEQEVWPNHMDHIRGRYRVPSLASEKALKAYWQTRLSQNKEECLRYNYLYFHYIVWMRDYAARSSRR